MDDAEWAQVAEKLTDSGARSLVEQIPRCSVEAIVARDENHPLARLFLDPQSPSVRLTANAVAKIVNWLGTEKGSRSRVWWESRLKLLTGDSAAGTLAEIRALGAALPTHSTIGGGLTIAPHSAAGRASDFRIDAGGTDVYLEVCCARMNQGEHERIEWVKSVEPRMRAAAQDAAIGALGNEATSSATAVATAERDRTGAKRERHQVSASAIPHDGGHVVLTFALDSRRPYGDPGADGEAQTLASRLAGKKPPGQVPADRAGLLWMDLSDPDWSIQVKQTMPLAVFRKGVNLCGTIGIWHSFYGRKGVTPLTDRHPIAFDSGMVTRQVFDGRFRSGDQRSWSAAVLRCIDGIVLFEHPSPNVPLPMTVLRELTDLEGYEPYASVHRFNDAPGALSRRLEETERMLAFYMA